MSPRLRSAVIRYGLAVLILFLAVLVRLAVDPIMGGGGFTVFIAAVIFISWVGGLGPALLAFVLSIGLSAFVFSSPEPAGPSESVKVWTGVGIFLVITVASALLSEAMRAARRRARWEAEEAIRQREQLRTTLACIGDAVMVTDNAGRLTMMNSIAEMLTGWSAAEAVGKTLDDVFQITNEQTGEVVESPIHRALREGVIVGLANHSILTSKDGTRRPIDDSAAPIRDAQGRINGVVLIFRDVTERRRTEQSLRDADRRKDEFLAMLAHELRNPLAPIATALNILRLPGIDAESTEWAKEVMERQVQHMVRLVDDLLDVSRIMRGKIELRREIVDIESIISSAVEASQSLLDARGHTFHLTLPPKPIYFVTDPVRLAQVVGNLLTNAAKYTEPGGQIWLEAKQVDDQLEVRVRDTGIGIPREMLPKVFDLFTQVDSSTTRSQGGLGIGLTLVKNLVELNGGKVEAHSEGSGKGSEFIVRLPVRKDLQADQSRPSREPTADTAAPKRRILVVDDNQDAAETLTALLRLGGHEVQAVNDGATAVECAKTQKPDFVFLDIGMPAMDGFEVARRLRQLPEGSQAILVALTGWGQEEDRRRTKEAGFDFHLVKPVDGSAIGELLSGSADSVLS